MIKLICDQLLETIHLKYAFSRGEGPKPIKSITTDHSIIKVTKGGKIDYDFKAKHYNTVNTFNSIVGLLTCRRWHWAVGYWSTCGDLSFLI